MKSLITINIGLETTRNTRVDVHHALSAVIACGVSITASAVVNGEWEGKPEPCLFVQGFVADPLAVGFRAQLYLASRLLSQHVIALYSDGKGELIGDNPEGWEFDADLFHFHPEGKKWSDTRVASKAEVLAILESPELSECQLVQRETAERIAAHRAEVNGYTRERFCDYLENAIIPDSKASGFEGYAIDLETALYFIRRA